MNNKSQIKKITNSHQPKTLKKRNKRTTNNELEIKDCKKSNNKLSD